ncbi:hypothetical protein MMC09_005475 [Bachmanniomyces sp. S44760]|nr:hypothetical protein [Bachmanniomyces sp. S44760]
MSWQETSQGHFTRPLDTTELFYRDIGKASGRESPPISAIARFSLSSSVEDPIQPLQLAWKAMRVKYPSMAAIDKGDHYEYDVPDASAVDSWMQETFQVASATTDANELFANVKQSNLAVIHYFPKNSEILVHCPHWRIDGMGIIMFTGQFFAALADPKDVKFGGEGANLSPSIETVGNCPKEATADGQIQIEELLRDFRPSMGLPTIQSQSPGATHRCYVEFVAHETLSVVSLCKANNITVTSAVHAAVVCVTQQLADHNNPSKVFMGVGVHDLRRYCPPPYNESDHAVTIYQTAFPALIIPSDFLTNAYQLQRAYSRLRVTPGFNVFDILRQYHETAHVMVNQGSPPGYPPPSAPDLSSLGIIDKYLPSQYKDKVEVHDFWIGVKMLMRMLCVHVWTWQGKLRMSISYNEAFYTADFVDAFLNTVKGLLLAELQILGFKNEIKEANGVAKSNSLHEQPQQENVYSSSNQESLGAIDVHRSVPENIPLENVRAKSLSTEHGTESNGRIHQHNGEYGTVTMDRLFDDAHEREVCNADQGLAEAYHELNKDGERVVQTPSQDWPAELNIQHRNDQVKHDDLQNNTAGPAHDVHRAERRMSTGIGATSVGEVLADTDEVD